MRNTNLSWVADLLNDLMHFLNCQVNDALIHPGGLLQRSDEHLLDVGYDLVSKVFRLL